MKQVGELINMIDSGLIRVIVVQGLHEKCGGICGASSDSDVFYIWLNADRSKDEIMSSFMHELWHIGRGDFERQCSVQEIEYVAHKAQDHNFYGYFDTVNLVPYLESAKITTIAQG